MNHLAHAYLSFNDPDLTIGNLIADFVKGKKQLELQRPEVQKGIHLHRAIDTYTDQHPMTAAAKQFFKPAVGLYSGVFTDLAFDHFLATDPNYFTDESLYSFTRNIYTLVEKRRAELPATFLEMFKYMYEFDWLYNYRTTDGIGRAIRGVSRRAKYLETSPDIVLATFIEHYDGLKKCYQAFFPELVAYVKSIYPNEQP
ncbi:ACP phosphodiesterase [Chitinophaga sp. Hz27]|uniref:acyl carrier protein phosphodiesterase n=1 Tax=Chitinophaga sp. Hz27 TaxID=3347169 RepID=UPI0035DB6CC1